MPIVYVVQMILVAMAIYHLHVKVIGRKSGAPASAAYRLGSRLRTSGSAVTVIFPASAASSIPR